MGIFPFLYIHIYIYSRGEMRLRCMTLPYLDFCKSCFLNHTILYSCFWFLFVFFCFLKDCGKGRHRHSEDHHSLYRDVEKVCATFAWCINLLHENCVTDFSILHSIYISDCYYVAHASSKHLETTGLFRISGDAVSYFFIRLPLKKKCARSLFLSSSLWIRIERKSHVCCYCY